MLYLLCCHDSLNNDVPMKINGENNPSGDDKDSTAFPETPLQTKNGA